MPVTRSNVLFIASAFLFLFLSLLLFLAVPTASSHLEIDSTGYDRVAHHFAQTGNLDDPNNPGQAFVQTAGYHFFVGVIYSFFGHRYWPVVWIQVLLALLSCWLTFLIARYFFDERVALVTAFLCAINLGFLVYPQFLLAEVLVVTMVLASVERYFAFWKSRRFRALVAAGLLGGFSIIVKPSALFFLMFAALFLFFSSLSVKRRLGAFLLFSLCFSAPLVGYLSYNKVRYGFFNLAPMTSLNMYHVFLSKVIARVQKVSVKQAEQQIPRFNSDNTLDERGWDGARKLFWKYAPSYPFVCLRVWIQNVCKTMFGLFTTQLKVLLSPEVKGGDVSFFAGTGSMFTRAWTYITKGSSAWWVTMVAMLETLWTFARYLLVLFAFGVLLAMRRYKTVLFFAMYIFLFAVITGFDGCCRYRTLFEPMLIILSSFSFVALYDLLKKKKVSCKGVVS